MTKTTVRYENRRSRQTYTLICIGHAGYAEEGKDDIVCAGISTLCYTLHNYLTTLHGEIIFKIEEEKGYLYLEFTNYGAVDLRAIYAFEVIQAGLETLASNYPHNVSVNVDVI